MLLASKEIFQDPQKAVDSVSQIKIGHKQFEMAEDIRTLGYLMTNGLDTSTKVGELMGAARDALKNGNPDETLEHLIEAVMLDKNYHDELPRKTTIALFHILGEQSELVRKYRRRFDMALY